MIWLLIYVAVALVSARVFYVLLVAELGNPEGDDYATAIGTSCVLGAAWPIVLPVYGSVRLWRAIAARS